MCPVGGMHVCPGDYFFFFLFRQSSLFIILYTKSDYSLVASIHFSRPDLIPMVDDHHGVPISLNPLPDTFSSLLFFVFLVLVLLVINDYYILDEEVPDVGELMLASFPQADFTRHTADNTWYSYLLFTFCRSIFICVKGG